MSTAPKLQTAKEILMETPWMQDRRASTLISSVLSFGLSFKALEKELFTIARNLCLEMLSQLLEVVDNAILYSAERTGWKVIEIRERTIETSLGVLTFSRRYYKKRTISGSYAYTFLLDEILGLPQGNISPRVIEMSVSLAAEQTYRKAEETLKATLGVDISHETIRQAVQIAGAHLKKWDEPTGLDNTGMREVPLLIIEADGVILHQQRRGRKKKNTKKERKFELKTAVIYEGWEKAPHGRAKLVNPTYFVHGGDGEQFWLALERHLSRTYNLNGCQRIIIAGDGALWVREGADLLEAEYQYCRFHLKRDLIKIFNRNSLKRKQVEKILKSGDGEAFNKLIDDLLQKEDDIAKKRELESFKNLTNNVWEGITDWRERQKPVPAEARGLGVIEPGVGHTISRRFKHQGAAWSIAGADNLAHVRCAKRNGNLFELLDLAAPPVSKNGLAVKKQLFNGYWARKGTDGLPKKDPAAWLRVTMPVARGPEQVLRDFAHLIERITRDWLL
jgi:hypothetical protein